VGMSEDILRKVCQMAKGETESFVVSVAKEKFMGLSKVKSVKATTLGLGQVRLTVYIDMPKYDDDLMDLLVDIEFEVNALARRHGHHFEFEFIPTV
jgi:hypothetical protein